MSQLRSALKASGAGEQIQRDGILAWLAGDPAARSVSPGTKTWPAGTKLITSPSGPPLVTGRASTAELRALPPRPAVDTTTAADQIAQQWAAAGARHQSQPGLPGAHHETRIRKA
jgi:hypothetical protein